MIAWLRCPHPYRGVAAIWPRCPQVERTLTSVTLRTRGVEPETVPQPAGSVTCTEYCVPPAVGLVEVKVPLGICTSTSVDVTTDAFRVTTAAPEASTNETVGGAPLRNPVPEITSACVSLLQTFAEGAVPLAGTTTTLVSDGGGITWIALPTLADAPLRLLTVIE